MLVELVKLVVALVVAFAVLVVGVAAFDVVPQVIPHLAVSHL